MIFAIEKFEIIGYPVIEGSKEWALYQIKSGKKVVKDGGGELCGGSFYKNRLFYINGYDCLVTENAIGFIDPCSEVEFLNLDETGWQLYKEPNPEPEPKERPLRNLILRAKEQGMNIRTWYQDLIFTPESLTSYLNNGKFRWWNIGDWELTKREANMPMPEPEPKPLLADAKVGDLCKRMDGKWVQIDSYSNDRPCPVMCKSDIGGQDCFTLDGRNHNAVNNDKDIIHTEPLAPEGSKDWAWQMMLLGKIIIHSEYRHENATWKMNNGIARSCLAGMSACSKEQWVANAIDNGWQIYEKPNPEPQYKVGDWVEVHGCCQARVINIEYSSISGEAKYATLSSNNRIRISYITRKLSPSEVIVRIGCLSGTIRYYLSFDNDGAKHDAIRIFNSNGKSIAVIHLEALDTSTRELVESLLEAMQEEEK